MLLIQIGLGMTQEYSYLVGGRTHPVSDSEFDLPHDCPKNADWKYVGVDMVDHYIDTAREQCPNGKFYEYAVVEQGYPDETIKHRGWRLSDDGFHIEDGVWGHIDKPYETRAITLAKLFEEVGKPDALVMDVENHELPILEGYPWDYHKPTYIKVEMHSRKSADVLVPLIMSQGYSLLRFNPVNEYWNFNTSDAQFLRFDAAIYERQRYEYGRND